MLARALRLEGRKVRMISCPGYGTWSAVFVEKYLNGWFGTRAEVGPYAASMFYALDRKAMARKIEGWLAQGNIVIADRFTESNRAFGIASLRGMRAWKAFDAWLTGFESGIMGIPQPDLNVLLAVPSEVSFKLVLKKHPRKYLKRGKRDLHERMKGLQRRVLRSYLWLAEQHPKVWGVVDCAPRGILLSKRYVHHAVMLVVWSKYRQ